MTRWGLFPGYLQQSKWIKDLTPKSQVLNTWLLFTGNLNIRSKEILIQVKESIISQKSKSIRERRKFRTLHQKHSQGWRCIIVKVYNQETHIITEGSQQDANHWLHSRTKRSLCEEMSKTASTLLRKNSLDRWNQVELVRMWWAEKSIDKKRNSSGSKSYPIICQTWWRHPMTWARMAASETASVYWWYKCW